MYNVIVARLICMAGKAKSSDKHKMPKGYLEGKARRRGVPIMHEEVKRNFNVTLTPTAIDLISKAAKAGGFSRSEFIERWARENLSPS
ncbi:hypothetical protein [Tolypothrix sp. VBCCA 56010]|uniref:hypothetical protein n=1 Tax=Tolypothrix sp. VBCCA 56010 TaxID=3137731 RepID=UPI003D7CD1B1